MDISVKKLSEILKIDPQVLLDKMIAAGLSQSSIEDSVSNEDKQKLLAFIRSSKDSSQESKSEVVVPKPQPTKSKEEKSKLDNQKKAPSEAKSEDSTKQNKTVNINGSVRVNDLSRKLSKRGNEVVKKLIELGEMVSLNDEIDQETAVLVAEEFGFEVWPIRQNSPIDTPSSIVTLSNILAV